MCTSVCVLCVDSHPSEERPPPTEMLTVSPGSRVLSIAEKSVGPATEPCWRCRVTPVAAESQASSRSTNTGPDGGPGGGGTGVPCCLTTAVFASSAAGRGAHAVLELFSLRKTPPVSQLFLCLSRACLGKKMMFRMKMRQKDFRTSSTVRLSCSARSRPPDSSARSTTQRRMGCRSTPARTTRSRAWRLRPSSRASTSSRTG